MFPIAAMVLDVILDGVPLTPGSLLRLQATEPLYWIIDSAPLVLTAAGFLLGRRRAALRLMEKRIPGEVQLLVNELLDSVLSAVVIIDEDGVIEFANA
ncbi:MAG: hypothetical protein ACE5GJ_01135, partial [Gemmatimonadota bacterium]